MWNWFANPNFTWAVTARVISLLFGIAFAAVMGQNIFGRAPFFPYVSIPIMPEVPVDITPSFTQPFPGQAYTNPTNTSLPQSFYLNDAVCTMPTYNDIFRQVFTDVLFLNAEGYLQTKLVDSGRAIGPQIAFFSFEIVVIFFEIVMCGMLYWKVKQSAEILTPVSIYTWTTQEMGYNIVRKLMTIGCEIIYTVIACAVGGIRSELEIISLCLLVVGWNLGYMSVQAFSVFSTSQLEEDPDNLKQHFEMVLNTDLTMSIVLEGLWAAVLIASGFNFSFKTFTTVVPFGAWTHSMTPVVSALIIAPPFYLFGVHLMILIFAFARAWMQDTYDNRNAGTGQGLPETDKGSAGSNTWNRVILFVDNLDAYKFIGFNLIIFLCLEVWAQTSSNQIPTLSCIV